MKYCLHTQPNWCKESKSLKKNKSKDHSTTKSKFKNIFLDMKAFLSKISSENLHPFWKYFYNFTLIQFVLRKHHICKSVRVSFNGKPILAEVLCSKNTYIYCLKIELTRQAFCIRQLFWCLFKIQKKFKKIFVFVMNSSSIFLKYSQLHLLFTNKFY